MAAFVLVLLGLQAGAGAQTTRPSRGPGGGSLPRITAAIENDRRTVLPGSLSPRARAADEAGELESAKLLHGITMSFAPSAAQQADLESLLAAQQDPASPQYHQWLTPEQFGARFGVADSDLAKIEGWLRGEGFTIEGVARGRNSITFSGTAGQVAAAFRTSLHLYRDGAESRFAPSSDLSLPAAFAGMVSGVENLSSFRPRPHLHRRTPEVASPRFTSSQSGKHFLTPNDVATLYDITPAYNSGYNGSGQTIAVVGQSNIRSIDITAFQGAAGLPVVAPTLVLVPSSGAPALYTGDESESDLDLEYSGGIATGATILFVYTGDNANYTVFDALTYAVNQRIAPIISISYGLCEAALPAASFTARNATLAQAAAQGQTIISASGDQGSSDCFQNTTVSTTTQQAPAVDFPASSPYVTGMGGTEFSAANSNASNTSYWASATGSDVISSVLSYIPEVVWNDDSSGGGTLNLSSSGGGTSTVTARPTWQTGVPGIPSGNFRLVPDVSLASSPVNVAYLYCSSDPSTNVSGSCLNGFRDVNNTILTTAGGTSFAAPIFAGMVAIINQSRSSTGQGSVNPTLYALASNPATYASAFHDITSGTNACPAGVAGCSTAAAAAYAATAGYDQSTGLGSVDFYKLLTAWPSGSATPAAAASTVTLTAATLTPAASTADAITIRVAAKASGSNPVPTGTISLAVDGVGSVPLTLSGGTATYSFSSAVAGTHTLVATYSGDGVYTGSSSTLVVTVGTPASTAAFSIAVPNLTVAAGSSTTGTVRVVPSSGYSGTIAWSLASRSSVANFCYTIANTSLAPGAAQATATLTVFTSSAVCTPVPTKALPAATLRSPGTIAANGRSGGGAAPGEVPAGLVLAGLLGIGFTRRRSRRWRPLLVLLLCAGLGLGFSGCSSSTAAAPTNPTAFTAAGTYTFTLTGTDTVTSTVNSSTNFTITVK